jgi:bifunctional non-homologous end joining protein LigD
MNSFVEPCLRTVAKQAPSGADWLFELKLDGYRLIVHRDGDRVRIYSRRGFDFTGRFPRVVQAVRRLKVQSVVLDGEGVVFDAKGMLSFALIHSKAYDREVSLTAFDLLGLDGQDWRKRPLRERKTRLAKLLAKAPDGIEFNRHIEGDGAAIFRNACKWS